MGFFSDLKEDLSQAVNEMMPEDGVEAANEDLLPDVDLSSMLDKMENMDLDQEMVATDTIPVEEIAETNDGFESIEQVSEAVEEVVFPESIVIPEPASIPEPVVIPEPAVAPEPIQRVETQDFYAKEEPQMEDQKEILDETAVITMGMEVNGDITTQGSLDLVGRMVGNVTALGKLSITGTIRGNSKAAEIYAEGAQINGDVDSEGAVKVGQSTVIIGNITATSAVIAGAVKGDIDVRGPVILDGSAIVMGNIKSKFVQINNGAVIEGMCSQCYADVNPTSFFEELKKSF